MQIPKVDCGQVVLSQVLPRACTLRAVCVKPGLCETWEDLRKDRWHLHGET